MLPLRSPGLGPCFPRIRKGTAREYAGALLLQRGFAPADAAGRSIRHPWNQGRQRGDDPQSARRIRGNSRSAAGKGKGGPAKRQGNGQSCRESGQHPARSVGASGASCRSIRFFPMAHPARARGISPPAGFAAGSGGSAAWSGYPGWTKWIAERRFQRCPDRCRAG